MHLASPRPAFRLDCHGLTIITAAAALRPEAKPLLSDFAGARLTIRFGARPRLTDTPAKACRSRNSRAAGGICDPEVPAAQMIRLRGDCPQ
jgi:hypothetical protein